MSLSVKLYNCTDFSLNTKTTRPSLEEASHELRMRRQQDRSNKLRPPHPECPNEAPLSRDEATQYGSTIQRKTPVETQTVPIHEVRYVAKCEQQH